MTFILALLLTMALGTPAPINGPDGWTMTTAPHDNVIGVWTSPTLDTGIVDRFRPSISLLSATSNIAAEEKTRDKQIAALGGTLERDTPTRCGQSEARWLEYVETKPSTIDTVALLIQKSPTELLVATYSRPVGTVVEPVVAAWFRHLCTEPVVSIV